MNFDKLDIDDRADAATILAALRYYQAQGLGDPSKRPDAIQDIATDGGTLTSLGDDEINWLCERLNIDHTTAPMPLLDALKYCDTFAILFDCVGNGKEIKSSHIFDCYKVNYTSERVWIGCKGRTLEGWKNFSGEEISRMDYGALGWWKYNKDFIISIIEKYPAKSAQARE